MSWPGSERVHQKPFDDISKLLADIKRIPELNFEPILREGAGRTSYSSSNYCLQLLKVFTLSLHLPPEPSC